MPPEAMLAGDAPLRRFLSAFQRTVPMRGVPL